MQSTDSASRSRRASTAEANARIDLRTLGSISHHAAHPEDISARLRALDREWDVERMLETGASVFVLLGLGLGRSRSPRWRLLPVAVGGFLLQHALQGWCPPLAVLRRLGVRTQREIDDERFALKLLRGDLDALPAAAEGSARMLEALRR